jgi:hypothetical protein
VVASLSTNASLVAAGEPVSWLASPRNQAAKPTAITSAATNATRVATPVKCRGGVATSSISAICGGAGIVIRQLSLRGGCLSGIFLWGLL